MSFAFQNLALELAIDMIDKDRIQEGSRWSVGRSLANYLRRADKCQSLGE